MANTTEPTQAHKALARTFYLQNAAMNAAKKNAEPARKQLFKDLEAAGIESFGFETTDYDGDKLRLDVEVADGDAQVADLKLLLELVGLEAFMEMVSVSKKAIEEHEKGGKAVAARVCSTEIGGGTRNVHVKPAAA